MPTSVMVYAGEAAEAERVRTSILGRVTGGDAAFAAPSPNITITVTPTKYRVKTNMRLFHRSRHLRVITERSACRMQRMITRRYTSRTYRKAYNDRQFVVIGRSDGP